MLENQSFLEEEFSLGQHIVRSVPYTTSRKYRVVYTVKRVQLYPSRWVLVTHYKSSGPRKPVIEMFLWHQPRRFDNIVAETSRFGFISSGVTRFVL